MEDNNLQFPVIYKAEIWDEVHRRKEHIKGVTFGESLKEAMENIEWYYGDDIISISLEPQESSTVWEIETIKNS